MFVVQLQQADPVRDVLACRLDAFALQLRGGQVHIVLDYRRDRQREKVDDVIGNQRVIGGVRNKVPHDDWHDFLEKIDLGLSSTSMMSAGMLASSVLGMYCLRL